MKPVLPFPGGEQPNAAQLERFEDDQLMAALKDGNTDALTGLYKRYHRLVFSIALKIIRDRGEAEDVMQNVFLEILRSVAQFDAAKGTTKGWILQYAYHRAISRKQYLNIRPHYSQESIEDNDPTISRVSSFLGGYAQVELKNLIQKGLATLAGPQRRVIEMASFDGLSMKEIAEKTGESLSNVRHHYYRGLKKLRSFVEGTGTTDIASNE